jgi:hypothetical protein
MKVDTKPKVFTPVTLTLETEGEVRFFRDVMGKTTNRTDTAYGMDTSVSQRVFDALDKVCDDFDIKRPTNVDINFKMGE